MPQYQYLLRPGLFFAVLVLLFAKEAHSQVNEIKDSTGLKTYSVGKGETVLIGYDSAYILNRRIFKLYQDAYKSVKAGNPSQKKLMDEYERLIALQDSML